MTKTVKLRMSLVWFAGLVAITMLWCATPAWASGTSSEQESVPEASTAAATANEVASVEIAPVEVVPVEPVPTEAASAEAAPADASPTEAASTDATASETAPALETEVKAATSNATPSDADTESESNRGSAEAANVNDSERAASEYSASGQDGAENEEGTIEASDTATTDASGNEAAQGGSDAANQSEADSAANGTDSADDVTKADDTTNATEAGKTADATEADEAADTADTADADIPAVVSTAAGANTSSASETPNPTDWERLAGAQALDTMRKIVQEGFDSAKTVVIATSAGYQDALTASSLAGAKDAPILLTESKKLSGQTAGEIKRLGAKNAYVIGGTKAISNDVVTSIKKLGLTVKRIAGQTAVQTAIAVADQLGSAKSTTAFVATAEGYQDALSASPYAYATTSPIFLASGTKGKTQAKLDKETLAAIKRGGYNEVVIVGGTVVVSKDVEGQLKNIGVATTKRIAGKTAYDTSNDVAEWSISRGMSRETVTVATGTNYLDAVMGGALAGSKNSPMVLVEDANRTAAAKVYRQHIKEVQKGYILGGVNAVSRVTEEYLKRPIGATTIIASQRSVDDGLYTLGFKKNTRFTVDVTGASVAVNTNVQLYSGNNTLAQKWQITWTGKGYSVRNLGTGRALAVAGGSMKSGANVVQVAYKANDNAQLWAIASDGAGGFVLRNLKSGMALDVTGARAANGANVRVADAAKGTSQRYLLKKTEALVDGGIYTFFANAGRTLAVDQPNYSTTVGLQMQLTKSNRMIAQKFVAHRLGANSFALQPVSAGLYLEDAGGKLVQKRKTNSVNQQWTIKLGSGGAMVVNVGTGNAFDVAGGTKKSGAKMSTATAANKGSQQLIVSKVDLLPSGTFTIVNAKSGKVLDVSGGYFNNKTNIDVATKNGSGAQAFKITKVGAYYRITNALTGRVVEVAGGSKANGANVQQYDSNGSAAQLWSAQVSPNGGIVFVNKKSGKVLDVAGGSTKSGANVDQYARNETAAQRWIPTYNSYKEVPAIAKAANKIMNSSSRTNYYMVIDQGAHQVIIFKGSRGKWRLQSNSICSVGKKSTPTVVGDFTVGSRGYSFGHGYTCYYWTQIYGNYLFHSTKYKQGTFIPSDPRLGKNISMGCVRLPIEYAKWINRNIPSGTHIKSYR